MSALSVELESYPTYSFFQRPTIIAVTKDPATTANKNNRQYFLQSVKQLVRPKEHDLQYQSILQLLQQPQNLWFIDNDSNWISSGKRNCSFRNTTQPH